jgi:hypothetical protein
MGTIKVNLNILIQIVVQWYERNKGRNSFCFFAVSIRILLIIISHYVLIIIYYLNLSVSYFLMLVENKSQEYGLK